jgi:hypothetical protein
MSKTLLTIMEAADSAEHEPDKKLSAQMEDGLRAVIAAVKETGGDGTVTLTIKVEPGAESRINITPKVKVSSPRPAVPAVTLYADSQGGAHRAQMGIFGDQSKKRGTNPQEN